MAEASAHADGLLVAMWICSDNVSTKGFEVTKSCYLFTWLQYCYQGTGSQYRSCRKKKKKSVLLSPSSSLSNNLFHTSLAPWYSLLLQVLTLLKKICSPLFTVGDKWGKFLLAVHAGVTACPYHSTQTINRQKPVTHLIKLKSSSCQTLFFGPPLFGPNGCLRSIMPLR